MILYFHVKIFNSSHELCSFTVGGDSRFFSPNHRPLLSPHLERWLLFWDFGQWCGFCKNMSGFYLLVRSGRGRSGRSDTHGTGCLNSGTHWIWAAETSNIQKALLTWYLVSPHLSLLRCLSWFFHYEDLMSQNPPYSRVFEASRQNTVRNLTVNLYWSWWLYFWEM